MPRSWRKRTDGKKHSAGALEVIPRTLAENAGLDPVNTIIALRKAHSEGKTTHGVNAMTEELSTCKPVMCTSQQGS